MVIYHITVKRMFCRSNRERPWCVFPRKTISKKEKSWKEKWMWCGSLCLGFWDYLRLNFLHLFRLQFFIVARNHKEIPILMACVDAVNGWKERMKAFTSITWRDLPLELTLSLRGFFFCFVLLALLFHLDISFGKDAWVWWKISLNPLLVFPSRNNCKADDDDAEWQRSSHWGSRYLLNHWFLVSKPKISLLKRHFGLRRILLSGAKTHVLAWNKVMGKRKMVCSEVVSHWAFLWKCLKDLGKGWIESHSIDLVLYGKLLGWINHALFF